MMKKQAGPGPTPSSQFPRVAIVIVHYNGEKLIRGCLSSLRKTDYPDRKVFVFDNGSSDNSKAIIEKEFPEAVLFSVKENMGLTKGANEAFCLSMAAYPCDYIAFLNNDIEIISPDWLSKMVGLARKTPQAGIVGCKLLYPDNTIQHAGEMFWPDRLRGKGEPADKYGSVEALPAVTLAAALISRKLLENEGLFDEVFSPFYYEDADLCFRAGKAGFSILYAGDVSLHHLEGGSMRADIGKDAVLARNAIIFYSRYAPIHQLLLMIARIYLRLIIRRSDKRKDFGKDNITLNLSFWGIVKLPYHALLMSAAIIKGLALSRSSRIRYCGARIKPGTSGPQAKRIL